MTKYHFEGPYNDDYNPAKNYTQILAVPGRAEQAREFTQLGSMNLDFIGRLGDALFKSGTIINGCTLVIRDKQAIISSGTIYLDGLVRNVDGAVLDITCVGSEIITAKIEHTIVTEFEDPSLRDPAQGYENYGQTGAHRVKEVVVFGVNEELASPVYRLEDGILLLETETNSADMFTEVLARRTFDENGSYKVKGFELRSRNEVRDNQILLSLTEGKAYIEGYEVQKGYASTVGLDFADTTRNVMNEPKRFYTNNKYYALNNQPVKCFNNVRCQIEVTETVTRGNILGGIDYLSKTPVVSIQSVKQNGKTFTEGTDYQLTNDGIDWSLPGTDPAIGTTYTVVYRYNKSMVVGKDIELATHQGSDCVHFKDGGDTPVNGTTFDIDYDFYLARKDMVCLNKLGEIIVLKGKPDIIRLAESPLNNDPNNLIMGTVLIYPNSKNIEIVNFHTTRLSQADLYTMYRRIEDMEYNQAISDLDKEAMDGEPATELKGIFTDGFIGLSKCDTAHQEFNCTIDLDMEELTLPVDTSITDLSPNLNTYDTNVKIMGRVMMAPYEHKLAISQPYATGTMLVNPYAVYNPMCPIALNPEVDNWIDTSKVVIEKQKTVSTTLRRWWYHRGESWAESEKKKWQALGLADGGESLGWNSTGTSTTTSSEVVMEEAILYMRQREVHVTGTNFVPNVDNIECYFNDTKVPLIATETTKPGTNTGTVRADNKGRFTGKFTVVPNTPCGAVQVKLTCPLCEGFATYKAQGRKRLIEETVLTTKVTIVPVDPLAQSFSFMEDSVVTKLGLYFGSKDPDKAVIVQIRDMVNGYPGTTCYAEATVLPEDISVSEKGTAVTEVVFNQPVYCRANIQYCICILSDSNLYTMFVASLGKKDILSGNYVTSQPYMTGVLFSSSNALTWTAHQTDDLKFDVYTAKYTGNKGVVVFNDVSDIVITRLVLAAESVDYKNAGIDWYYKINNGAWLPIETYVDRDLSTTASVISLKAELKVAYSTSPIIATDCISLIGFIEQLKGVYVSRNVVMDENYTKIKISCEACLPSGTSLTAYYMTTGGTMDWIKVTATPTITPISTEFSKYEWNVTGVNATNYRIKLELNASNPLVRPRVRKLMSILKY